MYVYIYIYTHTYTRTHKQVDPEYGLPEKLKRFSNEKFDQKFLSNFLSLAMPARGFIARALGYHYMALSDTKSAATANSHNNPAANPTAGVAQTQTPTTPGAANTGGVVNAGAGGANGTFEPLVRKRTFDQYAADELNACREDAEARDLDGGDHDMKDAGVASASVNGSNSGAVVHSGAINTTNNSSNKQVKFDVLSRTKIIGETARECSLCGRVTQAEHSMYKRWVFACPMSGGRWRRPLVWKWGVDMSEAGNVSEFMQAPPP
jgi:hypothetical protein